MDRSFHYLLMASNSLFQRRVMAELAATGLTAGQPKVLDYLGLHDGSAQKDIAAGCQIDPATLTGLLARMEEKGLVCRETKPGDRRTLHVRLTDLGWERRRQVRQVLEALDREILSAVPPERREALAGDLLAICETMTDLEELQ